MDTLAYQSLRDLQDEHWWFVGRRKIIRKILERHIPRGPEIEILEAGCGYGGNLAMLADFGRVSAFEFDKGAREFAKELSGVDVKAGELPQNLSQLSSSTYDLIVMLDVLEHITEDLMSLKVLRDHLVKDGRILITVPAHQWLWSGHDEIHHHKRRYSRETLGDCLVDAGLEPVEMRYFNTFLFPIAVAQRLVLHSRKRTASVDRLPAPAFNSLLANVFASERAFLGKFAMPFGLSLYAVAKRAK